MTTHPTLAYVHSPKPPYERLAGPIYPSSVDRRIGLSVQSRTDLIFSVADISEAWIRPGMCWLIDESSIGEDPWAGFVDEESIPYHADSIDVPLVGLKEALLSVEVAVRLPMPVSRGFAIKRVLELAQELNIGVFPGIIEQAGASVELDVRGETVSNFIDSVKEVSAADWRERIVLSGNKIVFYLDYGYLLNQTNITLGPEDIVEGVLVRKPITSSITVLGQAGGFADRRAASTSGNSNRLGGSASEATMSPLEQPASDLMLERDIGPAAGRHMIEISERFDGNSLSSYAYERHLELLRGVDQLSLTLDATRANVRRIKLGDVCRIDMPNWISGMNVVADIHIREINPNAADGKRIISAVVLL